MLPIIGKHQRPRQVTKGSQVLNCMQTLVLTMLATLFSVLEKKKARAGIEPAPCTP